MRPRLRRLVPLSIFVLVTAFLGVGLTIDSTRVPSPLVGREIPAFDLPAVKDPQQRVRPGNFRGEAWLLNVWATWCVACREEHEVLMTAAREHGLTIVGLDYKDERDAALDWFDRLGDPYVVSAFDADGRAAIDLGVYGVPETYVIDRHGIIRYKHIGPISPGQLLDRILPLVQRLEAQKTDG